MSRPAPPPLCWGLADSGNASDPDPSPHNEDGTRFERWPASVTELLEKTAQSLETGRPYEDRYRPKVVDGVLDWEILPS